MRPTRPPATWREVAPLCEVVELLAAWVVDEEPPAAAGVVVAPVAGVVAPTAGVVAAGVVAPTAGVVAAAVVAPVAEATALVPPVVPEQTVPPADWIVKVPENEQKRVRNGLFGYCGVCRI